MSVTLKKNVIVITVCGEERINGVVSGTWVLDSLFERATRAPSVRQSATKKSAKGGMPNRAFSVANAAERNTKGATILNIWGLRGKKNKTKQKNRVPRSADRRRGGRKPDWGWCLRGGQPSGRD